MLISPFLLNAVIDANSLLLDASKPTAVRLPVSYISTTWATWFCIVQAETSSAREKDAKRLQKKGTRDLEGAGGDNAAEQPEDSSEDVGALEMSWPPALSKTDDKVYIVSFLNMGSRCIVAMLPYSAAKGNITPTLVPNMLTESK